MVINETTGARCCGKGAARPEQAACPAAVASGCSPGNQRDRLGLPGMDRSRHGTSFRATNDAYSLSWSAANVGAIWFVWALDDRNEAAVDTANNTDFRQGWQVQQRAGARLQFCYRLLGRLVRLQRGSYRHTMGISILGLGQSDDH